MTTNYPTLSGLHHVTAITGDAQKNINFYCGVLGLRLVKLTVNFDDPASYHLYYGDELGRPGTILTFFAWPGAPGGRVGPPQVTATAFSIPKEAIAYWVMRFAAHDIEAKLHDNRFGERVLAFLDPDGMELEIVGADQSASPTAVPWPSGPIPVDNAIRGLHSVTMSERKGEPTVALLTGVMGYEPLGNEDNRFRYRAGRGAGAGDNGPGTLIDLLQVPDVRHGNLGAGVVHHVAFRTSDDAQQAAWHEAIARLGLTVSPIMDRRYFHSIYYREPGGVLFEIATCNPGFTADQPAAELGSKLMLPPWLEPQRLEIERAVPPIQLPAFGSVGNTKR